MLLLRKSKGNVSFPKQIRMTQSVNPKHCADPIRPKNKKEYIQKNRSNQ